MAQKSPPSSTAMPAFLELLEQRIAPAAVVIGDFNFDSKASGYTQQGAEAKTPNPFIPAKEIPITGSGLNFSDNHYALNLTKGQVVGVAAQGGGGTPEFIKLLSRSGAAYAFFHDKDGNGIPTTTELTGLSLANGTKIKVNGNVDGDIVVNRNAGSGEVPPAGVTPRGPGISSNSLIAGGSIPYLFVGGTVGGVSGVEGKIIAGGNISNLTVNKTSVIQSGTPDYDKADRFKYDFGGSSSIGGVGILDSFTPAAGRAGGGLTNITASSVDYILAGPGGAGAPGGNLTKVLVTADPNGAVIRAGDGGDGIRGGRGGAISQVVFAGTPGAVDNAPLEVKAGQGGDSTSSSSGGRGGAVSNVWLGYEYSNSSRTAIAETVNALAANVLVQGGKGGVGATAGAGGSVTKINIFADTPNQTDLPVKTYELQVKGGDGGDMVAASKAAGAGGAVTLVKIKNVDTADKPADDPSDVWIKGGNASASDRAIDALQPGRGAAGGSVSNPLPKAGELWLVGASYRVEGGAGSDTQAGGGKGGNVAGMSFQPFSSLYLEELAAIAGAGGNSATGRGGAGGSVSQLRVPAGDFGGDLPPPFPPTLPARLNIVAGVGGNSTSSFGGAGGAITTVDVYDIDLKSLGRITTLPAEVTAGAGGDGLRGGGVGGSIKSINLFSTAASIKLTAGEGGDSTGSARGKGGVGGSVSAVAFVSQNNAVFAPNPDPAETATLIAGNGGKASGSGSGGSGGSFTRVNVETQGAVSFKAGEGGSAQSGGRSGNGGSLGGARVDQGISATSLLRSVDIGAGSAGLPDGPAVPKTGGAGGSVINAVISAAVNVTTLEEKSIAVKAGDGAAGNTGGAGGSLRSVGFYGAEVDSALKGDVRLTAGNGGNALAERGRSGAGGGISGLVGYTSDDARNLQQNPPHILAVKAGKGGGTAGVGIGGAGGTVNGLSLLGGNAPFFVLAGDGGDGRSGGVGGSVLNLASAAKSVALSLAAGDGGDGTLGRAGAGGSLNKVDVIGDIGIRLGVAYGYTENGTNMGGIFAGRGGSASGVEAPAGSVTNVTAQAISAIVAGREASPYLVKTVDSVYLRGNEAAGAVGSILPNVAVNGAVGFGSGGGTANVLGNGSALSFTGDYNTDLSVKLQTKGGVFDGVSVIYIDADGNDSGITDTSLLSAPFGPLDELTRAVAGVSYQPPVLDTTEDGTALLRTTPAQQNINPAAGGTPQGWSFTVGPKNVVLSSLSFGFYAQDVTGFSDIQVSLYPGKDFTPASVPLPIKFTPSKTQYLVKDDPSYVQWGDLSWELAAGQVYTIAATGSPYSASGASAPPATPAVARTTGQLLQTDNLITGAASTASGVDYAATLEVPAPVLLDNTGIRSSLLSQQPVSLASAPQGWTFTANSATTIDAISFGLYGIGTAEVGVRLYAGSTLVDEEPATSVTLGPLPAYQEWSRLGWSLESGKTYTVAAYGGVGSANAFLALTSEQISSASPALSAVDSATFAPSRNYAFLAKSPANVVLLDNTAQETATMRTPPVSLASSPQGWSFTANNATIVDSVSMGIYGSGTNGFAQVGLTLYEGTTTLLPIKTQSPTLVGFGTGSTSGVPGDVYQTWPDLGWSLEKGKSYTIAAYGIAGVDFDTGSAFEPYLALTDKPLASANPTLSPIDSTAFAPGRNFALLLQSPSSYQSVLSFSPGFLPEYAIAFSKDTAAFYDLTTSALTPKSLGPVAKSGTPTVTDYSFKTSLFELGLSAKVASSFNFVGSYLAGPSLIPAGLPQEVGAYRTNQSVGFAVAGADPGSGLPARTPAPPTSPVTSFLTYTQQLANFVGAKSQTPAGTDFKTLTGTFLPNATDPAFTDWNYGAGGTQPLDGLVAAATITDKRNFMPLAWLTAANAGKAQLWLPTIPTLP